MRLVCTLFVLATTTTIISSQWTTQQKTRLENLAAIYAQLTLTFNPVELNILSDHDIRLLDGTPLTTIGPILETTLPPVTVSTGAKKKVKKTTTTQAPSPLNTFYRTNEREFDKFQEVENFFADENLIKLFSDIPNIPINDLRRRLKEQINHYQQRIISDKNKVPLTFTEFYSIFTTITTQDELDFLATLNNDGFLRQFCGSSQVNTRDSVDKALQAFDITYPKLDKDSQPREQKMLTLSDDYTASLEGNSLPKPNGWTAHHIIPSDTLVTFYHYYFKLISQKSQVFISHNRIDWAKIMEINVQKSFLIQAQRAWYNNPKGATLPVKITDKHPDKQIDFIGAFFRWPPGLIYYGPNPSTRTDDPSNKNKKTKLPIYDGQPNDFELLAEHIIGKPYFDKVKQLNGELLAFIQRYESGDTMTLVDENEAVRLYTRLRTINLEYNGKPIFVFPFLTYQWVYTPETNTWKINRNFNADRCIYQPDTRTWLNWTPDGRLSIISEFTGEWIEKTVAQREFYQSNHHLGFNNFDSIDLNMVALSAGLSIIEHSISRPRSDLKRRKRHPFYDPSNYIDDLRAKCKTLEPLTTTTDSIIKVIDFNHPKADSCGYYLNTGTPSILAVPYWGLCKIFG